MVEGKARNMAQRVVNLKGSFLEGIGRFLVRESHRVRSKQGFGTGKAIRQLGKTPERQAQKQTRSDDMPLKADHRQRLKRNNTLSCAPYRKINNGFPRGRQDASWPQ